MPTRLVLVLEITIAGTPPILNTVGLLRSVPVMVTRVPTLPLAGLIEVIAGGGNCAVLAKTLGFVHISKSRIVKI
jgi:hypothetical protein